MATIGIRTKKRVQRATFPIFRMTSCLLAETWLVLSGGPSVGLLERQTDVDHGEKSEDEGLQERDDEPEAHEDRGHADRDEA